MRTKAIREILLAVICLGVLCVGAHASSIYDNSGYFIKKVTLTIADGKTSGSVVMPTDPNEGKIVWATANIANLTTDSTVKIGISQTVYQAGSYWTKTLNDNGVSEGFIGGSSSPAWIPLIPGTKYWTALSPGGNAQSGAKTIVITYYIDRNAPPFKLITSSITIANGAASGSAQLSSGTIFGNISCLTAVIPSLTSSVATTFHYRNNTTIDSNYLKASSSTAEAQTATIFDVPSYGEAFPLVGPGDASKMYITATAAGNQTGAKVIYIRYVTYDQRNN